MEIVFQTPPKHFHHIRRTGDMNVKIARIELMHNLLQTLDRFFGLLAFHENNDVARLSVVRD